MYIKQNGKIRKMTDEELWQYQKETAISLEQSIEELKEKLNNTDYLSLKHREGELTDEEFAPILAQRKEWRAEINKLQDLLKGEN